MQTGAMICAVDDCEDPVYARGCCQKHYRRLYRHGSPTILNGRTEGQNTCMIEGCDRPYHIRGMCQMHHRRWYRHGVRR
jgi:hypothetical protein